MAVEPDPHHASPWHATRLSDRVAAARVRAAGRRRGAVLDLRLDAESRLTDQVRFEVTARLHHLVETIAHDVLQQADRVMPEGARHPSRKRSCGFSIARMRWPTRHWSTNWSRRSGRA